LCAEHVRSCGGESPLPNLVEVKGAQGARAAVARRGLKEARSDTARADGQEPDLRRERRASGQVTAKPVSTKGAERKSGGCASKAIGLTSGDLRGAPGTAVPGNGLREPGGSLIAAQKSAAGIVGVSSRSTRLGHSPERGETAGLAGPGTSRTKAQTVWSGE
jgi:hypothetical protein